MATWIWYTNGPAHAFGGLVDFDTHTLKVSLHTSYTPNQDSHDFFDDVSSTEVSNGSGYTTGGVTVAGTISVIGASNRTALIIVDPAWTAVTKAFQHAILRRDTGSAATSPLLGYIDLGSQNIAGVNFTIDCDGTNGALYIDVT